MNADRRLHVIAPPGAQPSRHPRVKVYRTAAIHECDVIDRNDGIRFTSRARTAYDLGRSLGTDELLSVMEQAMHDGRLNDADMRRVAVDWLSKRRPWGYAFLDQLDRRLGGPAAESGPEVRVGQALKAAGVRGLTRQFEIELPAYGRARFDLGVPPLKWAVEVDVHPTHDATAGRMSDRRRDSGADGLGWIVSRITRSEYYGAFDQAIAELVTVFHRRRAERR